MTALLSLTEKSALHEIHAVTCTSVRPHARPLGSTTRTQWNTDRQADRQTGRQADRQTGRQAQSYIHTDIWKSSRFYDSSTVHDTVPDLMEILHDAFQAPRGCVTTAWHPWGGEMPSTTPLQPGTISNTLKRPTVTIARRRLGGEGGGGGGRRRGGGGAAVRMNRPPPPSHTMCSICKAPQTSDAAGGVWRNRHIHIFHSAMDALLRDQPLYTNFLLHGAVDDVRHEGIISLLQSAMALALPTERLHRLNFSDPLHLSNY